MPNQGKATDLEFTNFTTLSLISFAALFVNVTHKICCPKHFFSCIKCAILVVRTFVLPEPAPASTCNGPSVLVTANFC